MTSGVDATEGEASLYLGNSAAGLVGEEVDSTTPSPKGC